MAGNLIPSGASIMIGGFLRCGSPTKVIDEILSLPTHDLTLIANDTCVPDSDRGKLIVNKRIKKAIVSHIGTNPETGHQPLPTDTEHWSGFDNRARRSA